MAEELEFTWSQKLGVVLLTTGLVGYVVMFIWLVVKLIIFFK